MSEYEIYLADIRGALERLDNKDREILEHYSDLLEAPVFSRIIEAYNDIKEERDLEEQLKSMFKDFCDNSGEEIPLE